MAILKLRMKKAKILIIMNLTQKMVNYLSFLKMIK